MNKDIRKLTDAAVEQVSGGSELDELIQPSSGLLPCECFCRADLSACPHTAEEQRDYNCTNCTLHTPAVL